MADHGIAVELAALQTLIQTAVAGAISRTVTVYTHDWDGFYNGPFPVVVIRPHQPTTKLLEHVANGRRGQDFSTTNVYRLHLEDAIDPRGRATPGGMGLIAQSEQDLETIWQAIDDAFDVAANRTNDSFMYAGSETRVRFSDPFEAAEDHTTRIIGVGLINVVGIPHQPG